MGINSRQIKNRAMEILESDEHQEARDEEFSNQFIDFIKPMLYDNDVITEDDVQGFIDSFDFPDEDEWAIDKACSEADDYGDMKMEEARDREMGL